MNMDDEYKNVVCDIERLDLKAINKIFDFINNTIHTSYE